MTFSYKTIAVIGATSGIGKAIAERLPSIPSAPTVIAVGRRQERLDELAKSSNGKIKTIRADVGPGDKAKKFVSQLLKEYPETDAVIIAAGIQRLGDLGEPEELNLDALDEEWAQNYSAVLHLAKPLLTHFKKQNKGAFIPVTSGLGYVPYSKVANYSASKAAVHSLLLSARHVYKDSPISIREISPPLVESELHDEQGTTEVLSQRWMPLADYADDTIHKLVNTDDFVITCGISVQLHKFEEGKLEKVM